MITYYSKHEINEHMLYAEEIAKYFGIVTTYEKPHSTFIHAYLNFYAEKNIKDYQQLYFMNKYGSLKKVYPRALYLIAIGVLFKETLTEVNKNYEVQIGNKTYKVKRTEEFFDA